MKRVTGLGGVFFKCEDPAAVRKWYAERLGIPSDDYGLNFTWREAEQPERSGLTVLSPFSKGSTYFAPSEKPFMLNFRVENLPELIEQLRAEGVTVVGEIQEETYGKFGWILDPEGNKIELWEPAEEE